MPFTATRMDIETIILSEIRQWKTNIIKYHLHVESLKKMIKMNFSFFLQTETDSRLWRTYGYRKGQVREVGGMDWGFRTGICTLRYMEWLANGDLLDSTENSTQYSVISYVGKESEGELRCVHVWLGHVYSRNYHNLIN